MGGTLQRPRWAHNGEVATSPAQNPPAHAFYSRFAQVLNGTTLAAAMLERLCAKGATGVFASHLHMLHVLLLDTPRLARLRMEVVEAKWQGAGDYPLKRERARACCSALQLACAVACGGALIRLLLAALSAIFTRRQHKTSKGLTTPALPTRRLRPQPQAAHVARAAGRVQRQPRAGGGSGLRGARARHVPRCGARTVHCARCCCRAHVTL